MPKYWKDRSSILRLASTAVETYGLLVTRRRAHGTKSKGTMVNSTSERLEEQLTRIGL